jgi:hypothetical protein
MKVTSRKRRVTGCLLAVLLGLCHAGITAAAEPSGQAQEPVTTGTAAGPGARAGGATAQQMLASGNDGGIEGLAFFRPVLNGVLYRAGFRGGDRAHTGLSGTQRTALCEAGFSGARYIDFGSKTRYDTTQCGAGTFEYAGGRADKPAQIMRDVHAVIVDPDKGPLLVHCMWGVHSSGAVSAMALVQFCGWSDERAKAYWNKARNGAACGRGGCDQWIDQKFDSFRVDPGLAITEEQRRRICPE